MGSPPCHIPRMRLKTGRVGVNNRRCHSLDMELLEEIYWRQLKIKEVNHVHIQQNALALRALVRITIRTKIKDQVHAENRCVY